MNLLQETREAIAESGHTEDQIVFIGSEKSGRECSWDAFVVMADVEYEHGFGSSKVGQDLVIVFADGKKLWRGEYDGSEWWEFDRPFTWPTESHPIRALFCSEEQVGWCDLKEINA